MEVKTKKRARAYNTWCSMRQRCLNEDNPQFHNYGGRGITICDRWFGDSGFSNFLSDMGEPPPGMSIDRINNDGGYSPENCRWATKREQTINRRITVYLERGGRRQTIEDWAAELGLESQTLYFRHWRGWPPEKIFNQSLQVKGAKGCNLNLTVGTETKTVAEWASISGLTASVILTRVRRGWPGESVLSPRLYTRKVVA